MTVPGSNREVFRRARWNLSEMIAGYLRAVALAAALLACSSAHSAILYRMQHVGGDTVGLAALNDAGTLVMAGFGDRGECLSVGAPGKSALVQPPYNPLPWQFVEGLPGIELRDCGVFVFRINSAGDMLGTSLRDGVRLPTFWRDGIAYDLRDPDNSGLTFVPDPGVRMVAFDFASLDVINLSDFPNLCCAPDWDVFPKSAWTNAGGLFVVTLNTTFRDVVVLFPVPEPPSIALVILGALVAARFGRPAQSEVHKAASWLRRGSASR